MNLSSGRIIDLSKNDLPYRVREIKAQRNVMWLIKS